MSYIVYDLDNWPKILLRNFTLKNYLFGATNIAKNSDKSKWVYSGYGTALVEKVSGVGNSLTSYINNYKNDYLVLGERDTLGINGSFGAPEKKFNINFSKAKTKFCLSLDYNGDDSYLFVNRKKSIILKQIIKMSTFQTSFV